MTATGSSEADSIVPSPGPICGIPIENKSGGRTTPNIPRINPYGVNVFKVDKFNKNVLPNMAFKGIIESIEYSRDTGDHYWASVKLTKTLKMGKIPKEYKYIYTIENNKIIKI